MKYKQNNDRTNSYCFHLNVSKSSYKQSFQMEVYNLVNLINLLLCVPQMGPRTSPEDTGAAEIQLNSSQRLRPQTD